MEERFSTRGRARLLHELARGDVLADGFDDVDIKESLAHCLSCKACKSSCPTKVDIAAYKSEFMARHYRSRRRPLAHHLIGRVGDRLPLLSKFPKLINGALNLPLVNRLIGKALGLAAERTLPALAPVPFKERLSVLIDEIPCQESEDFYWFGCDRDNRKQKVVLWLDSFNSHYKPQVIESALRLLTAQGFSVAIARVHFCCGRPLYEYGMLSEAKQRLQHIMDNFYPTLPEDTPVVVLEPSCLSVFREELIQQLGENEAVNDLAARSITLADFLDRHEMLPKKSSGKALVHLHCHHKSLESTSAEKRYLQQCFESLQEPEPGCCGMAGVFGLQKATRPLSERIFNNRLGPALENVSDDTIDVTNGFSCHEQLADRAGIKTLHVAEVLEAKFQEDNIV